MPELRYEEKSRAWGFPDLEVRRTGVLEPTGNENTVLYGVIIDERSDGSVQVSVGKLEENRVRPDNRGYFDASYQEVLDEVSDEGDLVEAARALVPEGDIQESPPGIAAD